jgi:hypothetical protein
VLRSKSNARIAVMDKIKVVEERISDYPEGF